MNKTNTIRYVTYCRKSSDSEDRQVQSIPDQKKELKPLQLNRKVVKTFGESQSAKKPGRPDFNEMIRMIKAGKADGIICWKLNRLARNPVDGGEIQWLLQQGIIKSIVTPGREYLPTDNVLMMAVELGMANQYVLDLSKDVKRGYKQKAERGTLPTGHKPGYIWDADAVKGQKEPLPDPLRLPLLQRAFKTILEQQRTPAEVFLMLNDEWGYRTRKTKKTGGRPLAKSRYYDILKDPFYYGPFEYPEGSGKWYKGTHKPIVTQEEFEKIQVILGSQGRPKPRKRNYPFKGPIQCGACGSGITAYEQWQCICTTCKHKFSCKNAKSCGRCGTSIESMSKPSILHYIRYKCTKSQNSDCAEGGMEATQIEKEISLFLSHVRVSEEFQQYAIECLNERNEEEVEYRKAQQASLQEAYNDCRRRLDNLLELKISPQNTDGSLLSDEDFGERKAELMKKKDNLKKELAKLDVRADEWIDTANKVFNFSRIAREKLEHGSDEEKRDILVALGSNLALKGKKLHIQSPSPYLIIEELVKNEPSVQQIFEPENKATTDRVVANIEKIWDKSPYVRGRKESNPL